MQKVKRYCLAIGLSFALIGCASMQDTSKVDTLNLSQLESAHTSPQSHEEKQPGVSPMRSKMIAESAMSVGAQGGLAWASMAMNDQLNKDSVYLDSIYNFNAMMLNHGVMPPVLEQGDNNLNLADPNTIRIADRSYKIIQQAHFATTAPNWREYLWLTYTKPELPDRTLLPRNADEQLVWRDNVKKGWEKGIEQGYSIFQQNLARLRRDFRGMGIYKKLLVENMISAPFVSRTELGVTGDGDDMRINDQVLRIVAHPQLQTSSKKWNAVVVKR